MASERVELFRRACDLFNRRDWEGFSALMGDGIDVQSRLTALS